MLSGISAYLWELNEQFLWKFLIPDKFYNTRARGFPPFFVVDDQMVLFPFSGVFLMSSQENVGAAAGWTQNHLPSTDLGV
jgi:hypothetical protein